MFAPQNLLKFETVIRKHMKTKKKVFSQHEYTFSTN